MGLTPWASAERVNDPPPGLPAHIQGNHFRTTSTGMGAGNPLHQHGRPCGPTMRKRARVLTTELDWAAAGGDAPAAEAAGALLDELEIEQVLTTAYAEVEKLSRISEHKQQEKRPRCSCPLRVGAMEAVSREGRGRGWVATADIPCGRTVLCESPLAFSMDWEADALESEADNVDSAGLILALARAMSDKGGPQLMAKLLTMAPLPGEPGKEWTCDDKKLNFDLEQSLKRVPKLSPAERRRIKRVVRANSLGIYTNPEQLCHPEHFTTLGGVALYHQSSLFNHNCRPNTTRFNVGTISVFRTNRLVRKGEELCISYIESDVLCEPATLRNLELGGRDFKVRDPDDDSDDDDDDADDMDEMEQPEDPKMYRKIDDEAQEAFLDLDPPARLENIAQVLAEDKQEQENPDTKEEEGEAPWLIRADYKELSLLQATACSELGYFAQALGHWEDCISFAAVHCPPHDEALVCYSVHAAIAALAAGSTAAAAVHAQTAAKTHAIAFGGGVEFFKRRYAKEVGIFGKGEDFSHVEKLWGLI